MTTFAKVGFPPHPLGGSEEDVSTVLLFLLTLLSSSFPSTTLLGDTFYSREGS